MIIVALGSNVGQREEYLAAARAALDAHDVEIRRASSLVETPALLPPGAPPEWDMPFLNQVITVACDYQPGSLLLIMKSIEAELGRKDRGRWGPREIDLDLIDYHGQIMVEEHLVLPHPRMDERAFVLRPLKEIAPEWRHPIFERTAEEMLKALNHG